MKIAFYTDTYLPNTDGVVSQIVSSKKELEKRKHYVHVFAPGTREEKKANKDATVTYYDGVKFPLYQEYKLALFPFKSILTAKELDIELIHCHALATMGLASIASAKALKLPLIGTFHTMIPLTMHYITKNRNAQEVLAKATWKAIKAFYKPFDLVTAPSKVIAELLEKHGVENVKAVSNGIEIDKFNPEINGKKIRKEYGIKEGEKVFLFVGRITKEKNVDVIIKAFENIDAKLFIVGHGPAYGEVKQLVKEKKLGDKVVLTGLVKHEKMPEVYNACNWQITASTFETQGLGILEGMACGKPCVGANSLAIPETIKHNKNGFLFEPFDANQCEQVMQTALQLSDSKYKQMSKNAVKTAEKVSIQKTVDQWEKIYNSF